MPKGDRFPVGVLAGLPFCAACLAAICLDTAQAHQALSGWTYPKECCSDAQDCQTIPAGDVSQDSDGYIVTLRPGEHRHAPRGGRFYMLDSQVKPSGDRDYHVCIHVYTNGPGAICLYIPHQGMSFVPSGSLAPVRNASLRAR